MKKRIETIEITCDVCGKKLDAKPAVGIKIRCGNRQPDHRMEVELHLMGDQDICDHCLRDSIKNGFDFLA